MPTYHATGIRVRLSTTDAALSTSETIAARTGPQSKINLERLEAVLDTATVLPEEDIQDERGDGGLKFIGDAGTPFLLKAVRVGGEKRDSLAGLQLVGEEEVTREMAKRAGVSLGSDSGLSSLGATPANTPLDAVFRDIHDTLDNTSDDNALDANGVGTGPPSIAASNIEFGQEPDPVLPWTRALSLTIKFDPNRSFKRTSYHTTHLDLKIDVFMNGQFISSTRCPASARNQAQFQTLRFSGLRIDRNIEKAWLLKDSTVLPSEKPKDDCDALLAAAKRWCDISAAIKREADAFGFDCKGQRPPVGDYLDSLSKEQMPHSVSHLPNPDENKYGVVDVVISMGEGRKYPVTAGYLATPLRMEDKRYGVLDGNFVPSQKGGDEPTIRDLETRQFFDMHPTIDAIRTRLIATLPQPSKNSTLAKDSLERTMHKPSGHHDQDEQPIDLSSLGEKTYTMGESERHRSEAIPSGGSSLERLSHIPDPSSEPVAGHESGQLLDPVAEQDVVDTLGNHKNKADLAGARRPTRSASVASYDRSMYEMQFNFGKVVEDLAKAEGRTSHEISRIVVEMGGSPVRNTRPTAPFQLSPRTDKPDPTQHGLPNHIDPPIRFKDAVNERPMPHLSMPEPGKRRSSSPLKNEIRLLSPLEPLTKTGDTEYLTQAAGSSSSIHSSPYLPTMSVAQKRKTVSDRPSRNKKQKIRQEEAHWKKSFDIPELSKNCVITYAAEAAQGLRQCRGERAGEFRETEVLLGVRFLVAGAEAKE